MTDEEAINWAVTFFSEGPVPARPVFRKFVLDFIEGEPVFRRASDEIALAFEAAMREIYGPDPKDDGDEIVPAKLAKAFAGLNCEK